MLTERATSARSGTLALAWFSRRWLNTGTFRTPSSWLYASDALRPRAPGMYTPAGNAGHFAVAVAAWTVQAGWNFGAESTRDTRKL